MPQKRFIRCLTGCAAWEAYQSTHSKKFEGFAYWSAPGTQCDMSADADDSFTMLARTLPLYPRPIGSTINFTGSAIKYEPTNNPMIDPHYNTATGQLDSLTAPVGTEVTLSLVNENCEGEGEVRVRQRRREQRTGLHTGMELAGASQVLKR